MDTHVCRGFPALALALTLSTPFHAAENALEAERRGPGQEVIKVEQLYMTVEGWSAHEPQPLFNEFGDSIKWSWYRLTFEVGERTCVFYSLHCPNVAATFNVSLVEREGEEWLLARLGGRHNAYRPHVYFPVSMNGKAGGFFRQDEAEDTWQFKPTRNLYAWETGSEFRHAGRLTVERIVNGKPEPLLDEGSDAESGVHRALIQHGGQTYAFYLCEMAPIDGRMVKVTREQFEGQDCFRLCGLIDEFPCDEYLPIRMAGRYGRLLPVKDREYTYVLRSLDEAMSDFFGLADAEPGSRQVQEKTDGP